MKKNTKRLIQIIGGIIMMIGISGCGASGNNPETPTESRVKASRTPEEAAVEVQFEPLFEFLAAEKKDFSKIQTFISDLSIDSKDTTLEENTLVLKLSDNTKRTFSGYFSEEIDGKEVRYNVNLEENGLGFEGVTPEKFNKNLYFVKVNKSDIKKGTVVSYSMHHPETELETLTYELDESLPLFKTMRAFFNIQEPIVSATLSLSNQGGQEFNAVFMLSTDEKSYSLGILVIFKNSGEMYESK